MLAPYNIIFEELVPFELEMQFNCEELVIEPSFVLTNYCHHNYSLDLLIPVVIYR